MACLNKNKLVFLNSYDITNPQIQLVDSVTSEQYHKQGTDQDYFYILLSNDHSFKYFDLETIIPKKIISKIQNKEACLVLDNSLEYFTSIIPVIYIDIVEKYNIPASQIVLITSVPNMEDYVSEYCTLQQTEPFKVEWVACFESMGKQAIELAPRKKIKNKIPRKRFLNLNRRWRLHRPFLVALMYNRGLLEHGYVSLGYSDDAVGWEEKYNELCNHYAGHDIISKLLQESADIVNFPPLYLDNTDLITNRAEHEQSINLYYQKTDFSVVTETTYYEDIPFFSEKIFKAIAMKHPFLLVTSPNSLKYLKELGYKTYHPYINEDYDNITDHGNRMLAIVDELERLCTMDEFEFLTLKKEIDKIAEFNYNILKDKTLKIVKKNF